MEKYITFEDEFMEVQSDLLVLTLETIGKGVDKIYAYCSIEEKSRMFNTFFEIDGEIRTLNQLGLDRKRAMQLLRTGTNKLEHIKNVCSKYNNLSPTEIKLIYDVRSGKLDAQYQYEEICSAKTNMSAGEVFMKWIDEMEQ